MRVITCENYEQMSKIAAYMVAGQLMLKPNSVLGLATGSTPEGMYAELAQIYQSGAIDFADVKTFNLDEYYPIARENDQSYYHFMSQHLYGKVNLKPENVHIPDGSAADADVECVNYDKAIESAGGVDLQILGIGGNGHIGFNEPASELNAGTYKVSLAEDTIKANARFFADENDVPREALTSGMATIMKARKIVLLASGAGKREPIAKLLSGKITTECPATMLNMHADVVIIADKAALGL